MNRRYAVLWRLANDGDAVYAGSLQLGDGGLRLEGAAGGRHAQAEVVYDTLVSAEIGRAAGERIAGRPALHLELDDGRGIRLTTLELGTFNELAEILQARLLADADA